MLENKSSIYFQQPSCSLAEKEQTDLQEKGIPEELSINKYKGNILIKNNSNESEINGILLYRQIMMKGKAG